jgi:lysophospholipase L1-like esterase
MSILLFQGDSVTDADRTSPGGDALGNGYVRLIAEALRARDSEDRVINRGISGNRVKDLLARWTQDCTQLQPDVLTILIGINDCWRKYDHNDETPLERFEADYDDILQQARAQTGVSRIILMEAFVLPIPPDRIPWRETLDPLLHATRRLAKKYGCELIPLDGILAAAGVAGEYADLCADGVHPAPKGCQLIAASWLKQFDMA